MKGFVTLQFMTIGQLMEVYEEEFVGKGNFDTLEKQRKLLRRVDHPYSPNHAKEIADLLEQIKSQMICNDEGMAKAITEEFKNRIDEYRAYSRS